MKNKSAKCTSEPEVELRTIRKGSRKGQRLANVGKIVLKKIRQKGRQRRLAYLLAVWRGDTAGHHQQSIEVKHHPPRT